METHGRVDIDSLPRKMLAGEEDAYLAFSELFGPRFRAYFMRQGLSAIDAEELAVSCITDVALAVDKFKDKGSGSFERWAFAIAHNMLMDWLKAQAPTIPLNEDRQTGRWFFRQENEAVRSAILEAIRELGEPDSTIVFMRLLEEPYTFSEIGERLGISEGAARTRYHRVLKKKLRMILQTKPAIVVLLRRSREFSKENKNPHVEAKQDKRTGQQSPGCGVGTASSE